MGKRKYRKDEEYIRRKIKKLEHKLLGKKRHRFYQESSSSASLHSKSDLEDMEIMDQVFPEDDDVVYLEENNLEVLLPPVTNVATVDAAPLSSPPAPEPASETTLPGPASETTPPEPDPVAAVPVTDLDCELLEILGNDPTSEKKYGKEIQKDLSVRLEHHCTKGLSTESRKELKEKYLTPDNCKLIDPPELNAEIKAAVSDVVIKRDKAIEGKQKQLTCAISAVGEAITLILSSKEKNTALLKLLMDSARLMCDCQHADSVTRRNFILNAGVKKEMKDQLQNTKIDKFLFGENLAETLKSAKAINKSGAELKLPASKTQNMRKPTPNTPHSSKNLNWKNPGPTRRQPGPQRMKQPAMTSSRNRPSSSSKTSSHHQQRSTHARR